MELSRDSIASNIHIIDNNTWWCEQRPYLKVYNGKYVFPWYSRFYYIPFWNLESADPSLPVRNYAKFPLNNTHFFLLLETNNWGHACYPKTWTEGFMQRSLCDFRSWDSIILKVDDEPLWWCVLYPIGKMYHYAALESTMLLDLS